MPNAAESEGERARERERERERAGGGVSEHARKRTWEGEREGEEEDKRGRETKREGNATPLAGNARVTYMGRLSCGAYCANCGPGTGPEPACGWNWFGRPCPAIMSTVVWPANPNQQ